MFAIVIEDLKIVLDNWNLLLGKSAIWFKLLAQKGKIDKQIVGTLY